MSRIFIALGVLELIFFKSFVNYVYIVNINWKYHFCFMYPCRIVFKVSQDLYSGNKIECKVSIMYDNGIHGVKLFPLSRD